MDMDMGMELIQKTKWSPNQNMVPPHKLKVLINNTIPNSRDRMTDTGFHTITLSRNLHIPWLKITK